jgi:hypothetical protein
LSVAAVEHYIHSHRDDVRVSDETSDAPNIISGKARSARTGCDEQIGFGFG